MAGSLIVMPLHLFLGCFLITDCRIWPCYVPRHMYSHLTRSISLALADVEPVADAGAGRVLPYGEHQAQLRRLVSNARSKLHCIAKRSATGNRSARNTLSLITSAGRAGARWGACPVAVAPQENTKTAVCGAAPLGVRNGDP